MLNIVGVLIVYFTSDFITLVVFGDINQKKNLLLFSLSLLMQGFIEIPMAYIRAKQLPLLFVTFSITKLILHLSMNIIFVVLLNMHVEGVIYSAIISSAIMGSALAIYTIRICGVSFSIHKAKKLVSFSQPLILASLISFYITFGDRYFLRNYGGLDAVGIYSLGYKFGFLLLFLVGAPFNAIWDSEKYNVAKEENARKIFSDVFIYYSTVVLLVCIVLSVFIKDILYIMVAPPFWSAAEIVPIILAAYVTSIWSQYVNIGIFLEKKTIEMTYGALLAGVVITAGYLYLIPLFGIIGAAWATLFAFTTRLLWVYFRARRLYDMGIIWRYNCFLIVLWVGVYGLSEIGRTYNLWLSLLWNSVLVAIVLSIVLFSPLLPHEIRGRLRQSLSQPKKLFSFK